ncbi:MAG: phosphate regulon transcriptional regulatory protein PhoB [Betaproteobacteria bacterium]|nr:MAG: phosphate regulon transcriptional regulatory protein PhoB [Betaproteobacteria bacterium]
MGGAILVVEDEPAIQELIAVNLEHAGHQVLRAANVPEAEALVREVLPDLVLLDWMLPGPPGVNFARQLRSDQRTKDIPIIMLTARAQEQDKITKPFSPRELLARIKAVMRRRAPQLTEDIVEIADLKLDPVAHRVSAAGGNIDLGPTEFRMLHFFMTHPERVYSRAQLLDEIWGDHVFVEERTVDVHIRRLRQALEPTEHDSLVETVRGTGYRFRRALA